MRPLSGLGIALGLIFGLLFLACSFELYYLLWWKRRIGTSHEFEEESATSDSVVTNILSMFCCNHSSSLSSAPLNLSTTINGCYDMKACEEREADTTLARLHNLSNPMGILFTIKEETKEDMESEDARSKRGSRGRSLSDVVIPIETPYLTPLSSPPFFTPPLTPLSHYTGFNPLFETVEREGEAMLLMASPPPRFKFMRDAEEKLYRKTLMDEAMKVQRSNGFGPKSHHEHLQQHSSSSHVVQFSSLIPTMAKHPNS